MYLGIFYIHCIIHNLYPICIMGNNKYTKRKHGKKHSANKGNVSRRRIYRMRGGNTPTGKNEEENEGGLMDTIKTSLGQFADQFKGKSDESTDAANESTDGTSKAVVFGSDAANESTDGTSKALVFGSDAASSTGESANVDAAGPDPAASTDESANIDAAGPITPQVVPDNSEEVSKLQERIDELEKEVNQLTMKSDNLAREKEEVQENFAEKAVKAMMKLFRSDDSDDEDDEDDEDDNSSLDVEDSPKKTDNDVEDDSQEQPDEDSL